MLQRLNWQRSKHLARVVCEVDRTATGYFAVSTGMTAPAKPTWSGSIDPLWTRGTKLGCHSYLARGPGAGFDATGAGYSR